MPAAFGDTLTEECPKVERKYCSAERTLIPQRISGATTSRIEAVISPRYLGPPNKENLRAALAHRGRAGSEERTERLLYFIFSFQENRVALASSEHLGALKVPKCDT